jgi:hypothetical protein
MFVVTSAKFQLPSAGPGAHANFDNFGISSPRIRDPEAQILACRTAKSPMAAFDPLRTLA